MKKLPFGVLDDIEQKEELGTNYVISIIDPINVFTSTILTSNLAVSYARQGYKTLLLDLNMTQSSLALMVVSECDFNVTTSDGYINKSSFRELTEFSFIKEFPTGGSICLCPASYEIKKRLSVRDLTKTELQTNLTNFLTFIALIKNDYNFIFINMPNGSEYQFLIHGTLASDYNFLVLDHNEVSIAHGLDLISNLEKIHPLIEFQGIFLHRFNFSPNMNDDERPLIESAFKIPIIALLPEIPHYFNHGRIELLYEDCNIQCLKYFKILSHELIKFIKSPEVITTQFYTIEVLIIANRAGIPLFTAYIKDGDIIPQNEILTSATLTAIVTGISAALKEISKDTSGDTKLIKLNNLSLVVENSAPLRAMLLTGRQESEVRPKIILFLENFKNKFEEEIKNFLGNIRPFQEALNLIEEIF